MSDQVRQNARAPEAIVIDIAPTSSTGFLPDLSIVTAAVLHCKTPGGFAELDCTLTYPASPQLPTSLRLTHVFTQYDIQSVGQYIVVPKLTATGYTYPIRCEPVSFGIIDEFQT
jgi:hypothetical protein